MITLTKSANEFLFNIGAHPSSWGLPSNLISKISAEKIGLLVFNSPASTLDLTMNQAITEARHLIILDKNSIRSLPAREVVGVILHEIGHTLNPPPALTEEQQIEEWAHDSTLTPDRSEVYADKFATECGYGHDFANALKRGLQNPHISARIKLLEQP